MADLLVESDAVISECGKYRYRLSRKWGHGGACMFIMLNPSTADASQDDPTIRRCINFARAWGYGELIVTNLFAVRATKPKDMFAASDPIGPDNMEHITKAADYCENGMTPEKGGPIICAWGAHGSHMDQSETVLGWLDIFKLNCLALTQAGQPRHPLYLKADLTPIPYGSPSRDQTGKQK